MSSPRIRVLPSEAARGGLTPRPEDARPAPSRRRVVLPLVRDVAWLSGALVAAGIVYLFRDDADTTLLVQRVWYSFVPLMGGVLLIVVAPAWARPRRYRVLLGIGLILVTLVGNTPADIKLFYADGWINILNVFGLVAVMAGVIDRVLRRQYLISARAAMESTMVAAFLAAAAWQFLFHQGVPSVADGPIITQLLTVGYVIGLTVLTWSRARDLALSIAATGATLLITTHVYTIHLAVNEQPRHWLPAAVGCVAWALVIIGLQRCGPYAQFATNPREAYVEGRSLVFLSTVTVAAVSGMIYLTVAQPQRIDKPTWICCGIFLGAGWARELIRAWQSHRMISQLESVATRDPLTGIGNLRALDDAIVRHAEGNLHRRNSRALARHQMSAMTVDVNRFKDVNELLGKNTADQLLRTLADLLSELTRHLDAQVFRTAGNEFLVLSQGRAEHIEAIAGELREKTTAAASSIPGLARIPLSAAAGIAHLPDNCDVTQDSLRLLAIQSTQAMRDAKQSRRAVGVFDDSLAATQRRNWQIETVLRERMARGEGVEVHFQPIISLTDGHLTSVEALARWCDPRLGDVTPTEFIAVAERCGLIERLGHQIMRDALVGAREAGLFAAGKKVAVNVSALQLRAPRFVSEVRGLLDTLAIPNRQLVIEVTESVFVSYDDPAVRSLNALHHEGISVVLDDFGTGYSSLSYLTRLPVEGLKIDRSITIDLDNTKTHAIASSIAQMAKRLDLEVVVEGVEDARQEEQVINLGLTRVQGWHYSKAVDVEALSALINLIHLPSQITDARHAAGNVTRLA